MKNISIWEDSISKKKFPKLEEDRDVDVLIIGGGIAGVSLLYHLRNSNLKVMLCEQNEIGMSVTGRSTGKLSYLQNDLIDKIRKSFDDNIALKYLNSQREAIKCVVDIISKEKIECDLEVADSYLYTNKDEEIEKLIKLEDFFNRCGIKTIKDGVDIVNYKYMFKVSDTYLFHPIKFVYGLLESDDFEVYANSSIQKIDRDEEGYLCYTDDYKIKAKYVVLTSHYPYFSIPYLFPIKGSLEKSYISASSYKTKPFSLISYGYPFVSARNYKDYLIYLSNSHDISVNTSDLENYRELNKKVIDKGLKPDYLWSNIDIMTNDGLPYIGEIKDNLFIATGFNTWGLASGTFSGKIISDIILGNYNDYVSLFNPKRVNFSQFLGSFVDAGKSLSGYINGFFVKSDNVKYDVCNGKRVMIYEKDGERYMVYHKCPHLGCGLIFNETEKTFDCPCHGSRFDLFGKCISGPSNKDISAG